MWLGVVLAKKLEVLDDWRELLKPIGIVAGLAIGLVLIGGDVGTVMILVAIVLGTLYFSGVRLRLLAIPAVVIVIAALASALSGGSRQEQTGKPPCRERVG